MWKRVVATTILMSAIVLEAAGDPVWTRMSPGGGGSFQTVDVAADGKVLVGSDLSGAYLRSGTGDWQRLGKRDGLITATVVAVAWKPAQSSIALVGTKKGIYRTADGGQSWTLVGFSGQHVSAIAWKGDVAYAAGASSSTNDAIVLRKSTDVGASWGAAITHGIPSGRRAVKLAIDPEDANEVWLLSGHDGYFSGAKDLYRSSSSGTSMAQANDDSMNTIDFALHPSNTSRVLMSTTVHGINPTSPDTKNDGFGFLYVSNSDGTQGTWNQGVVATNPNPSTGAVWWSGDGSVAYMVNVYADACAGSGSNEFARAGRFEGTTTNGWSTSSWAKVDDGVGGLSNTAQWDDVTGNAWVNCDHARGRAIRTVAKTLSAKGEYWVTARHVWRYKTSAPYKYENAHTTLVATGPPTTWITKGIDNAVPRALTGLGNGSGVLYAGYYDVGIWKSTDNGGSWSNVSPDLGTWDGYGGSVTGIVATSSYVWATMGESSKVDDGDGLYHFGLWRSSNSGTSWQLLGTGLPSTGFMHGLSRDPVTGTLWVTVGGLLFKSINDGSNWSAEASGSIASHTTGLYVTAAKNGVVLVGGTHGLHRWNGSSWSEVASASPTFNFSDNTNIPASDDVHQVQWHGIHQILFDPSVTDRVWAVSYYKPAASPPHSTKRIGVWKSEDGGATFGPVFSQVMRRGIAVDLSGTRLHITSGPETTAGINEAADMDSAIGKQTCVADGSGEYLAANCVDETNSAHYRFPFGDPIYSEQCGLIYVGVPGYGFMRQDLSCGGGGGGCEEPPCEIENDLVGGGDGESMPGTVLGSEMDFPLELRGLHPNPSGGLSLVSWSIPRAEAGARFALALYDIAGRKIVTLAEGVAVAGRFTQEVSFASEQGKAQRNGVYFIRLTVGGREMRLTAVLAR